MIKNLFFIVIGLIFCFAAHAQLNYQDQYTIAKNLYREGKYNLAMESFKKLIPYDQQNPFSEYASFYYALSAYHQGYLAVAKDMLLQIKSTHPSWDKMDEVNLWLTKIHFDKQEYAQGFQTFSTIQNAKTQRESAALKAAAVRAITDVDLLKSLHQKFPEDVEIGTRLARLLSESASITDKNLLDSLIQKFRLRKSDFIEEVPQTIFRDTYSVSLLFPFVVNTLEPTANRKRNQFVLDLYQGMELAVDTLGKMGINISLRAYDTERNADKLKKMLERNELKNTDLIVGPLFNEENTIVQNFARAHQINIFNPLSNNSDVIAGNPYAFLFQPSNETIGNHAAKFVAKTVTNKKCIVFYGDSKRDSVLAANFIAEATLQGLQVKAEPVTKESSRKIIDILATPTEFDEFKYPKQFSLPKDSLGSIYVASEEPLIYTKVISSVETRGDNVTVVGFESWLDQMAVDYEKYQKLNIVLAAPNFASFDNPWYNAFQKKFIRVHGRGSSTTAYSNYAMLGFDFMLFVGSALKKHGVYFQQAIQKEPWVPGYISQGYDFTGTHNNHLIPFVKFDGGRLVVVDVE